MPVVLVDDYPYTISDQAGAEGRLRYDIENNVNGMLDRHRKNLESLGKKRIEDDQSGAYVGFLSGLSNSPEAVQYFLGSRRFPEDISRGRNPNERYFIDPETNDLMFVDIDGIYGPKGQSYKEFENISTWGDLDADDFTSWMGPGAQMLMEGVLGATGMVKGAALGTATMGPGAGTVVGGVGGASVGSGAGTAVGQGIRSGLSLMLGGPESSADQLVTDMFWSAGFGLVPIGLPKGAVRAAFRQLGDAALPKIGYLREKFQDEASQDIIRSILKEGGGDVDKTIAEAAKRGIKLTRGEALKGVGQAAFAQNTFGAGSRGKMLVDMYTDRAKSVSNLVTKFADELTSGKYIPSKLKDPLSGKVKGESGSFAPTDVARAADAFIKNYLKERQKQAGELYRKAFSLDQGGEAKLEALVDSFLTAKAIPNTSMNGAPIPGILTRLKDPDLDPLFKATYTQLAEVLTSKKRLQDFKADPTTVVVTETPYREIVLKGKKPGYLAINTSEDVARVLRSTFDTLITKAKSSTENRSKELAKELSQIKASLDAAFSGYNPVYAQAKAVYSEDDVLSALTDVKIINDIAKVAEAGGTEAARAVGRLFSGSAMPVDIVKLKDAVQTVNPMAWQRVKGDFLRTKFADISGRTASELGVPNKFLSALQLQGDLSGLTKTANLDDVSRQVAVYRTIFEPDELEELAKVSDILQSVASIQNKLGSATQPRFKFDQRLDVESLKLGREAPELIFNMFGILGRTAKQIRDTVNSSLSAKYRQERIDAYEDLLIEQILNPRSDGRIIQQMEKAYPVYFAAAQTALREGAKEIAEEETPPPEEQIRRKVQEPSEAELERIRTDLEALRGGQTSVMPSMDIPTFEPLPDGVSAISSNVIDSPTLLPSDQDRELARRLQGGIGGLGAIA